MSLLYELKKFHDVSVVAPFDEYTDLIIEKGFDLENISLERSGKSIFNEILLIYRYFKIIRKYNNINNVDKANDALRPKYSILSNFSFGISK